MPGGDTYGVKGNVVAERVTASRREDLTCVTSVKVLSYNRAWCITVKIRRRWPRSTSNENIMFYSSWKNTKVGIIYVFTNEVDSAWGSGNIGRFMAELDLEFSDKFVPALCVFGCCRETAIHVFQGGEDGDWCISCWKNCHPEKYEMKLQAPLQPCPASGQRKGGPG
jgi:hypothetical protein